MNASPWIIRVILAGVFGFTCLPAMHAIAATPIATPASESEFWREDFTTGLPGNQPPGWSDASEDVSFNAHIANSHLASHAAITRTAQSTWGKVLSPLLQCNPEEYSLVEIRISGAAPAATWKIGIQEFGTSNYYDLSASLSGAGTYTFNYAAVTGWIGLKTFYVQITVEGGSSEWILADYVSVRRLPPTATPTPSSTPTSTPTPTRTATPTATPSQLMTDFRVEELEGAPGAQPAGWVDAAQDPSFNACIAYSYTTSAAAVTRTAAGTWGKVLSPEIRCATSSYPYVEIDVTSVAPGATWRVGIQEEGTSFYANLCNSQSQPGKLWFNYTAFTGWYSEKRFRIQLTVEGGEGAYITVQSLRVYGPRRSAAPQDFVTIRPSEPEQLEWRGNPVKIKGANYYPSAHGWAEMWTEWDPALITTELSRCQDLKLNSIRTFVHYAEFGGPAVRRDMLARMEEFLYIAAKFGLRVEFVFFPLDRNYGPAYRPDMKQHVQAILERFRGDDRVLGWGVTNELDLYALVDSPTAADEQEAYDWHNELAACMQAADPNHLIIAGSCRPETVRRLDLNTVDVIDLHTGGMKDAQQGMIMRTRQWLKDRQAAKPILFQEFGLDFAPTPPAATVSSFFTTVWNQIYATDIAGGMVWALNDIDSQTWGLYTAAGIQRPGVSVIRTAYTGTDFRWPSYVPPRPATPLPLVPEAAGTEQVLLQASLEDLDQQWRPGLNPADMTATSNGVRLDGLVRDPGKIYAVGCIEKVQSYRVNLDQEADLRIHIREVHGAWHAYLGDTTNAFALRLQLDTAATGLLTYNLKDYLPPAWLSGNRDLLLAVGVCETSRCFDQAAVLVENVSVVNGSRPTPAATPEGTFWMDDFNDTAGVQPALWQDDSVAPGFHAEIACSWSRSIAAVTRTAEDTWGKVLSPVIRADVTAYPRVELSIPALASNTAWKLGIQEVGGAWQYWPLNASTTSPGVYAFDYAAATGWSGAHDFQIQVAVEGLPGAWVEMDWVRICQAGAVSASAVQGYPSLPANLPAAPQPTFTPTVPAAATATPTASPRPWVEAGRVLAYPNPARDRVVFAFTAEGAVQAAVDCYSMAGERVARVTGASDAGSGQTLTLAWKTAGLAPGIYICRVVVKDASGHEIVRQVKKVAVIR